MREEREERGDLGREVRVVQLRDHPSSTPILQRPQALEITAAEHRSISIRTSLVALFVSTIGIVIAYIPEFKCSDNKT